MATTTRIAEGDKAPAFKILDQDGESFDSKELKGKAYVLYFYPRAATPG